MLGSIHDIRAIAEEVHKVEGARLCVDGVAYAPHGEVDYTQSLIPPFQTQLVPYLLKLNWYPIF